MSDLQKDFAEAVLAASHEPFKAIPLLSAVYSEVERNGSFRAVNIDEGTFVHAAGQAARAVFAKAKAEISAGRNDELDLEILKKVFVLTGGPRGARIDVRDYQSTCGISEAEYVQDHFEMARDAYKRGVQPLWMDRLVEMVEQRGDLKKSNITAEEWKNAFGADYPSYISLVDAHLDHSRLTKLEKS